MASAPVLPSVSVDEYLHSSYQPECEYLDGILEEKRLGSKKHSYLQYGIIEALVPARKTFGLRICPEYRIRVAPRRFRVPDVSVFVGEPVGERFAETPPLFTVEVVSPDDTFAALQLTAADQLAGGVRLVIIADPERRTVFTVRAEEGLHEVHSPKRIPIDVPDRGTLVLDFGELFKNL